MKCLPASPIHLKSHRPEGSASNEPLPDTTDRSHMSCVHAWGPWQVWLTRSLNERDSFWPISGAVLENVPLIPCRLFADRHRVLSVEGKSSQASCLRYIYWRHILLVLSLILTHGSAVNTFSVTLERVLLLFYKWLLSQWQLFTFWKYLQHDCWSKCGELWYNIQKCINIWKVINIRLWFWNSDMLNTW